MGFEHRICFSIGGGGVRKWILQIRGIWSGHPCHILLVINIFELQIEYHDILIQTLVFSFWVSGEKLVS
jgi:hypothetical protein